MMSGEGGKLFATYQPFYTEDELEKGLDKRSLERFDGLNMERPVWAFSCDTVGDACIGSILCAPRFPEVLWIYEASEFARLDKAAWYRTGNIDNDAKCVDYVTDEIEDDARCEFVIDAARCLPRATVGLRFLDEVLEIEGIGSDKMPLRIMLHPGCDYEGLDDVLARTLRVYETFSNDISVMEYDVPLNCGAGVPKSQVEFKLAMNRRKNACERTLLPMLVSLILSEDDGFDAVRTKSDVIRHRLLWKQTNNDVYLPFARWSRSMDDSDGVGRAVDELRELFSLPVDLVIELTENGNAYGRNDPCPCGSGKKFKRCHGRFFL